MTTATLVAAAAGKLRPVPWHRLAWVAWRRYRTTVLAVLALLVIVAGDLLARGHQMRDAYAALQACAPQGSPSCRFAFAQFRDTYANTGLIGAAFVWVPAIIGAFAGAPLLAAAFETGTFRYAWTQGAGRTRWMVSLTAAGLLGVALLSTAFGLLVSWYQQPLFDSGLQQRLHASAFPVTGIAVISWALLAFALGVFLGLVTRRVVAALALTLATWTGLAFLAGSVFRDHYRPPLVTSSMQLGLTDLPVDQWWEINGARATDAHINQVLQNIGVQSGGGGNFQAAPGSSTIDPVQYLMQHGFTQLTSYQPDSRYWLFQWIEFGWLTVLSALLLGASIWLLRRRPA